MLIKVQALTLTPMLNAYLMKGGEQKKTKFYTFTEPFFVNLNKKSFDVIIFNGNEFIFFNSFEINNENE